MKDLNTDQNMNKLISKQNGRGKLKIFYSYAPGSGKTYAMLKDALEQQGLGVNVLVGYVEPHTLPESIQLINGLPTLKPIVVENDNLKLKDFDLSTALNMKPQLILVDELAHSNVEGSRNKKRYQDIEELLNAGINVYTTLNVQNIESLNHVIQDFTHIYNEETIPDNIFDNADNVKFIDIEPTELLKRLNEGKIYRLKNSSKSKSLIFTLENLKLLRKFAIEKIENSKVKVILRKLIQIKFDNILIFSWLDLCKTFGLLTIATIFSWGLHFFDIGSQNIMMMYILSVLIISRTTRGYAYGVLASVISVLTFNFLFTEPYYSFHAIQVGYPITFVIMLIVALITSALTVRIKTQAMIVVERERQMYASQAAMALERQYLSEEQGRILIESEKEKMRSNLLRAISHDLRTPLTGILGASSAILENSDLMDKQTHHKLISDIKEDSQWLIRIVENLLAVTRINEGKMNVVKSPEAVEEIVAEAISRIRKRYENRKINVKVPNELLFVPMDGTLIEQVIMNLVENAIKHSGDNTAIDIVVKNLNKEVLFEVSDNGEGIPAEDFPHLFDSYVPNKRISSDSSRGMGIGLSICMSIVKAHNGKMEVANKIDGGAVFRFMLPIDGDEKYEQ